MSNFKHPNGKYGLEVGGRHSVNHFPDQSVNAEADEVPMQMRATKVTDVVGVRKDDKTLNCGTKSAVAQETVGTKGHGLWTERPTFIEVDLTNSDDDEDNEFGSDIVMSETPSPEDLDGRSSKVDYLSSKGENGSEWHPDGNHVDKGGANDVVSVDESYDWDSFFNIEKVTVSVYSSSSSLVHNRNERPGGANLDSESLFNSDEWSELPDVYYDPEDDASSFGSATTLSSTPPYDRLKDVECDFSLDSSELAETDVANGDLETNSSLHSSYTIKNKSEQLTEQPLPIPITDTIVGRSLEAAISPFVHQGNILWLAKLKGNPGVEIVPGSLMNRTFPLDVIQFYERRLNLEDLEQPAVILSINEMDPSPYLKQNKLSY